MDDVRATSSAASLPGRACQTARPVRSRLGVTAAQGEGRQGRKAGGARLNRRHGGAVDRLDHLFSAEQSGGDGSAGRGQAMIRRQMGRQG